jgi:hypothetical protein
VKGLSPLTWELVQKVFTPDQAETAGQMLVAECGQNLPFLEHCDEQKLERVRFAALKISRGDLHRLQQAIDQAKRDWRDELVWAGFAERLDAHVRWAEDVLGRKLPQP